MGIECIKNVRKICLKNILLFYPNNCFFYQIKNSLRAGVILGTSVGCRHKDDLYVINLIFSTLP